MNYSVVQEDLELTRSLILDLIIEGYGILTHCDGQSSQKRCRHWSSCYRNTLEVLEDLKKGGGGGE